MATTINQLTVEEFQKHFNKLSVNYKSKDGFYVVLIGYNNQCKTLIDYPFATIEEARKGTMSYKGKCKTAYITKGKPVGFEEI